LNLFELGNLFVYLIILFFDWRATIVPVGKATPGDYQAHMMVMEARTMGLT
jgi:hypothetical protein